MTPFSLKLNKTTQNYSPLEKALFCSSLNQKGAVMAKGYGKNTQNTLMEHLSTTVGTTGQNTGLGWNDTIKDSSRKVVKYNQVKVFDKPAYKYENKFFPRRNITSKILHIGGSRRGNRKQFAKFGPKGYIIDKENNNQNINITRLPDNVTGSVPSRTSSKIASSSYVKVSPGVKNTYFSPNWQKTPYQQTYAHPAPVYKRSV